MSRAGRREKNNNLFITSSFLFCLLWTCSVDHVQSRQKRKEEVINELLFLSLLFP
jgi:hypothetical protein